MMNKDGTFKYIDTFDGSNDNDDLVVDVLHRMLQQESTTYKQHSESSTSSEDSCGDDQLLETWRRMLLQWMYFVVDYCDLNRACVSVGSYYLDSAVAKGLVHCRDEYQLAAATSLQLALKAYDCASIHLDKLVMLGRGAFNKADVIGMETEIATALNWQLHPPTSDCFLQQYLCLLPASVSEVTRNCIQELTEIITQAVVCENLSGSPSMVAFAAMLVAMEHILSCDLSICQRQCFLWNVAYITSLTSAMPQIQQFVQTIRLLVAGNERWLQLTQTFAPVASPLSRKKPMLSASGSTQSPRQVASLGTSYR